MLMTLKFESAQARGKVWSMKNLCLELDLEENWEVKDDFAQDIGME